jgi:catechol 2,3-dioxygenase-like lactoylglutathione lyase family enzyme
MFIQQLTLSTASPERLQHFYTELLQLPLTPSDDGIQIGTTRLYFQADSSFQGNYHLAFNIPENQFEAAKRWIMERTPLIRDKQGRDQFHFESWNAHSCYFFDSDGNILEFIARHDLKNATSKAFNSNHIFCVSEIGLAHDNPHSLAQQLRAEIEGLGVFRNSESADFCALGDDNGLFIIVKHGREWYPESGKRATPHPVRLRIQMERAYRVTGAPYTVELD